MADQILGGLVHSGQNVLVSYDGTKLTFTPQDVLPVKEPEAEIAETPEALPGEAAAESDPAVQAALPEAVQTALPEERPEE